MRRRLAPPSGVDFSSNDFLCLANDERLKRAAAEALEKYGVGATASRLLRGERDVFAEVEKAFAAWKGAEKSLYFSSGFTANVGTLSAFLEKGDTVFSDELNHASLIDGMRLSKAETVRFSHRNLAEVRRILRETQTSGQKFLVTESLFSMDGTIAPLREYAELCAETGTALIVDEAHAVGVYGANGSGLIEEKGIGESVFLSVNTAGKALGAAGAFVCGSASAIEYLLQKSRSFIFSTAPLPLTAEVLLASVEIVKNEPERRRKLLEIAAFFQSLLREKGFAAPDEVSQIMPIRIGSSVRAVEIAERLQNQGFDVRAIRPPTVPEGTSRLRVSLNIGLSEKILREFAHRLQCEIERSK